VVAAFLELNHALTLGATLPFLLLGQVAQFLVSGAVPILRICAVLAASQIGMPWGVALHTEAPVTGPAFHEPAPPTTIGGRVFLHEGRTILEGAVHLQGRRDGRFRLPGGENLKAGLGEELVALMDVEFVAAAVVRTLDLGAARCDLLLRVVLTTVEAVLVGTPSCAHE